MVARTVTQYARAGLAALHIEDQVQTKRCGHLMGKQVVPVEEFTTRIRAAVQARDAIPGSDIVIIARSDALQVLGFDEALARLKAAVVAGADVCFIEGVRTKEELRKTVQTLAPTPVLVNVISGGFTPSFTVQEAQEMGAKIISKSTRACCVTYTWDAGVLTPLSSSFLACVLRRCGARHSRCNAFLEEDWNRLFFGSGNGSEGVLRSNGYVDHRKVV